MGPADKVNFFRWVSMLKGFGTIEVRKMMGGVACTI